MSSVAGWWGGMEAGGAVGGRELVRVYVQSVKVPQALGRSRPRHRHWGATAGLRAQERKARPPTSPRCARAPAGPLLQNAPGVWLCALTVRCLKPLGWCLMSASSL